MNETIARATALSVDLRAFPRTHSNTCSGYGQGRGGSTDSRARQNRRRSLAMLPVGAPALNRDEALELLAQLKAALFELRRLRAQVEAR
jgi:hypothetical protein